MALERYTLQRTGRSHAFAVGDTTAACGRAQRALQDAGWRPTRPGDRSCQGCRRQERLVVDPAPAAGLSCTSCGSTLDQADPTLPSGRGACRLCRE